MEFHRNQPMKFGPELSDMHEVSDVEVSFTNGLREQRDVDVGSGDGDDLDDLVDPVEVELDGQLETAFPWNDNLADKNSDEYLEKKNILETDLKSILEADDDIEKVEMDDCTFTEAGGERRRRNADNTTAQADYTLSVTGTNITATEAAASNAITNANHTLLNSFNENSANSYAQTVRPAETNITVPEVTPEAATTPKAEPATSTETATEAPPTRPPSQKPDISGCPITEAATILICTVFFL